MGPFSVPAGADKAKLKVKVMLNLNGVVVVESAQLIEEEEVEEEAPAPAADEPMADAAAGEDGAAAAGAAEPPAAGTDAAAAAGEPAPMAEDAAPAKVTKKRVKKHAVPFASHTAALSVERLQQLEEEEAELALQVGPRDGLLCAQCLQWACGLRRHGKDAALDACKEGGGS